MEALNAMHVIQDITWLKLYPLVAKKYVFVTMVLEQQVNIVNIMGQKNVLHVCPVMNQMALLAI